MKTLTSLFKTIVSIDSTSGKEDEMTQFVQNYLQELGLNPIVDESGMIYCRIGDGANPTLFCAHMDTVEPGIGIKPIEENGFIKSNGKTILGGDNKASLSAILYSVRNLLENENELNIELLFSVREETDSGIQNFDVNKIFSKVGFVFDGGNGNLGWFAQSAPTIEDFVIQIKGKSAHASLPENGINALQVLIDAGQIIKLGRPDEFSTFNIGLIEGGFSTNTIPETLTLKGDLRSTRTRNYQENKILLENTLRSFADKLGAKLHIQWIPYSIGYEMNIESENYISLNEIYNRNGVAINPMSVTSGSDAAFLNSVGIETFCLGDGVVDPHKLSERIAVSDLNKLSMIIQDLMLNYKY